MYDMDGFGGGCLVGLHGLRFWVVGWWDRVAERSISEEIAGPGYRATTIAKP